MLEIWRRSNPPIQEQASPEFQLQCWTSYLFISDTELSLPSRVASLLPGNEADRFEYDVNFQDFVGVCIAGDETLRVTSSKLDCEGFDRLLADITASVANLPFDFRTPTFLPHERVSAESEDALYHTFAYLRWAMSSATPSLSELVEGIASDPHRQLVCTTRRTSLEKARRVGRREVARIASGQTAWQPIDHGHALAQTMVAIRVGALTGTLALPAMVEETVRSESVDTPENRFVKYLLTWLSGLVSRFETHLVPCLDETGRREVLALRDRVTRLAQARWLEDVGEMRAFPASSQVLQRKQGYRDVLRHHLSLVMTSRYPIAGADLRRILEIKSASTLYEYWVFFQVVGSVERSLGRAPLRAARANVAKGLGSHLDHGVSVDFGEGIEVIYNRPFRGGGVEGGYRSYSLPLRPDVVLRVGDRLFVLDAKFRVERPRQERISATDADELGIDTEAPADGLAGWFKPEDIHKMHTYRDAARHSEGLRVCSAWTVYPGSELAFYGDMSGRALPDEVPADLQGVGAIPLEPRGSKASLDFIIDAMIGGSLD